MKVNLPLASKSCFDGNFAVISCISFHESSDPYLANSFLRHAFCIIFDDNVAVVKIDNVTISLIIQYVVKIWG